MTSMVRAHVHIEGKVQGVYFRDTTRRRAEEAGVQGWVRNLRDGRVEVILEGPRDAVESMLDFCREGPPMANVTAVEVEWENDLYDDLDGFRILTTE